MQACRSLHALSTLVVELQPLSTLYPLPKIGFPDCNCYWKQTSELHGYCRVPSLSNQYDSGACG